MGASSSWPAAGARHSRATAREILRLGKATDVVLNRNAQGAYEAVLLGEPASNSLKLLP